MPDLIRPTVWEIWAKVVAYLNGSLRGAGALLEQHCRLVGITENRAFIVVSDHWLDTVQNQRRVIEMAFSDVMDRDIAVVLAAKSKEE